MPKFTVIAVPLNGPITGLCQTCTKDATTPMGAAVSALPSIDTSNCGRIFVTNGSYTSCFRLPEYALSEV